MKLDAIKSSSYRVKWNLREIHKITQYKDDCVYRTRSLGLIVCKPDYQLLTQKDIMVSAISTKISKQLY